MRRARPSPSPKVWEEVTFLKRAATAKRRRSKFPEVFRGLRRQRLIFFSLHTEACTSCTVVYCIPHEGW